MPEKTIKGYRVIVSQEDTLLLDSITSFRTTKKKSCVLVYPLINGAPLHQVIMGKPNGGFVTDHVNRNTLDNRRENLRFLTYSESNINRNPWGISAAKGVYFDKNRNKWRAYKRVNGKQKQLGRFSSEQEAVAVLVQKID